jgi:hypothetical protein
LIVGAGGVPAGQLAGLLLGERDQVAQRLRRKRLIGDDQDRRGGDQADRREILVDVIAGTGAEANPARHDSQGVTIRNCLGEIAKADHAARAPAILDDHLLAERRR